jgi:hypothetical protein
MFINFIKKAAMWLFAVTMFTIMSVIIILASIPALPFVIIAAMTTPRRPDLDY